MKIVILSSSHPKALGGETRVAFEQAKFLAKHMEVVIVHPGEFNGVLESDYGYTQVSIKSEGSDALRVPSLGSKNLNYLYSFFEDFKPDVMHAHSQLGIALIGQVWANMNNIPFFYTVHEIPSKFGEWFESKGTSLLSKFMESKLSQKYFLTFFNGCDAIIALNQVSHDDMKQYGYEGPIHIIPNGRDMGMYKDLNRPSVKKKVKELIFVGSVGPRKNQEYLLKVMGELSNEYRLKLIGRFHSDEYEVKFRKLLSKHKNVEFVGTVSPDEIPGYLESSHLMLSASLAEVQSLSVLEALVAGTPIVGLPNETINELIDDTVGARMEIETTPKEFAKKVVEILSVNNKEYAKLCDSAKKHVEEFDWDKVVIRTIDEVYSKYSNGERKVISKEERVSRVIKMLNYIPDFGFKDELLSRVESWRQSTKQKADRWVKASKLSKGTMLVGGITIGVLSGLYLLLKVGKKFKKK